MFYKPDKYEIQPSATISNAYGSTMADTSKTNTMTSRPNRFGFSRKTTATHTAYDDLNEREEGFDLNREIGRPAGKSSGLPRSGSI